MKINKIIDNYLVFVILAIFGFIVFWYSLVKQDYFTVLMALLLLFIFQFKIERICHNKGKTVEKEQQKKHEKMKNEDKLHQRIRHHIVHHAKKVRESEFFRLRYLSKLKNLFAAVSLHKSDKSSQSVDFEKPFRNSLHETFLDDMYKQIQDAGQINISQLAVRYGLPQNAIEEFVKVLDKEKLVELYYPAIGIPVVRRLNYLAELKLKKGANNIGVGDNSNGSNSKIVHDANKKQKIINLVLFGILVFAVVMIGYLVYLNRFA